MAKQSDDNLENFFLNRVNNYDIDFREGDWQKLNEMLDASAAMKAAALKQKMIWVGSGALLVISVVLMLWMSQNLTSRRVADQGMSDRTETGDMNNSEEDINPMVTKEKKKVSDTEINNKTQEVVDEDRAETVEEDGNRNEIDKLSVNTAKPEFVPNDNSSEPVKNAIKKKLSSEGSNDLLAIDSNNRTAPNIDDTPVSNDAGKSFVAEEIVTVRQEYDGYQINSFDLRPSGPIFPLNREPEPGITANFKNESMNVELQKNYSWNLSIAADFSAVGMTNFDGPSIRAGLSLEYYLSKRLSILAGVNYSVKTYTAFGREYTPPYGFWTYGVVPDETLGECNVLDIPLNLTYYILNRKGQSFFVRSGLSSWLMLEEHYYYNYDSNDPDLVDYWGGENENYHFLGILNLSAGFEHPINNKYSILAEPYLNIPLGGVGFGEVDLHSAGMKVTFKINRYKLSEIK